MERKGHMMNKEKIVQCEGKERVSNAVARNAAKRMSRKYKARIVSYRCKHCGFYHVGNKDRDLKR